MITHFKFDECVHEYEPMFRKLGDYLTGICETKDDEDSDFDTDEYIVEIIKERRAKNTLCYMYSDGENPVGMLVYERLNDGIKINDLFVYEEYRNHGIGKSLMDEALSSNTGNVYLSTPYENTDAIKFYNRLGFQCEPVNLMLTR